MTVLMLDATDGSLIKRIPHRGLVHDLDGSDASLVAVLTGDREIALERPVGQLLYGNFGRNQTGMPMAVILCSPGARRHQTCRWDAAPIWNVNSSQIAARYPEWCNLDG